MGMNDGVQSTLGPAPRAARTSMPVASSLRQTDVEMVIASFRCFDKPWAFHYTTQ